MAKSKKRRNILIAVGVLAVIGIIAAVLVYVFIYNKPHRNYETAKVDFMLTSDEIYDAFEADEQAAFNQYQDKVVVVSGPIESINEIQDGMIQVVLIAENAMIGGVKAQLHPKYSEDEEYSAHVSELQKGGQATLKCHCVGIDSEVVLDNCFISEESK